MESKTENITAAVSFKNISKHFGNKYANTNVSFDIYHGEILALLGENGSGKTTLMNVLSGIYHQDSGEIYVNGNLVAINSPKDAYKYKIGMVHQHFKLIEVFTSLENIILGIKPNHKKGEENHAKKKVGEQIGRAHV